MREFSVGSVLARSLGIWIRNLIPFMLLSAFVYSPIIIYTVFSIGRIEQADDPVQTANVWGIVLTFGGLLLDVIITGAIIYGVVEELRGRRPSVGASISVGIQRLLPVLGTGLLVALFVGLGLLALVIPGVILMCRYFVAVPVAVIERPGVGASLTRSKELTDGYKGQIFGMLFLLGIIERLLIWILEKVLVDSLAGFKIYAYAILAASIAFGALQAVVAAVTYSDLRENKEGTNAEELGRVFD